MVPIHLLRHFRRTDWQCQTDDSVMPIADHSACSYYARLQNDTFSLQRTWTINNWVRQPENRRWNQWSSSVLACTNCHCMQTMNRRRCRRPSAAATVLTISPCSLVPHLRRYMSARRWRAMPIHSCQSQMYLNRKWTWVNHVMLTSPPTSTCRSATIIGENNLTEREREWCGLFWLTDWLVRWRDMNLIKQTCGKQTAVERGSWNP